MLKLDDPRPQVLGYLLDPRSGNTRSRHSRLEDAVDVGEARERDVTLAEEIMQADGTPTFRELCTL